MWLKQYTGDSLAYGCDLFQHNDQLVLIGGTAPTPIANTKLWVLYVDSNGVVASYDTSKPKLLFSLDTERQTWSNTTVDSLKGWVQNLSDDSVYFNFGVQVKSVFFNYTSFDDQHDIFGSSQKPVGIGPRETLPVNIRIDPYEPPANDTEHICYTITPVGEAVSAPPQLCVTLYPESLGSVATSAADNLPDLSVFPNPASDMLTVEYSTNRSEVAVVEIFDVLGHQLLTTSFQQQAGRNSHSLDLSSLPDGHYVVRVEGANLLSSKPLLLTHNLR
jgi:hypothetical protein